MEREMLNLLAIKKMCYYFCIKLDSKLINFIQMAKISAPYSILCALIVV